MLRVTSTSVTTHVICYFEEKPSHALRGQRHQTGRVLSLLFFVFIVVFRQLSAQRSTLGAITITNFPTMFHDESPVLLWDDCDKKYDAFLEGHN